MAKPFSIQAPEEIAKQYAGNKQQIAAAMQMGVVDPTAGVLAGMFIDRMRAAQMQEQAPQATVAQQVMGGAPPAQPAAPAPAPASPSPGGLGATPQAAPPMAPPMPQMPAAPQMPQGPGMAEGGDVNSYRLTSPPEYERFRAEDVPAPTFEDLIRQLTGGGIHHKVGKGTARARYSPLDKRADYGVDYPIDDRTDVFAGARGNRGVVPTDFQIGVRHRFADGGMVPPYASGGLSDVPVPDTMFDEPSNGGFDDGYGGGGLVAFARGGPLTDDEAWSRIKRLEGGLGPNGEMRVSSAGAVGPAQLMPATAPEAARIAGLPWDEKRYRTDPAYNEALGRAYYLSRVSARGGDYNKAALDYHSGMGNVDKGKIGPAGREYLRKFTQDSMPERDINTAAGRMASIEDIDRYVEGRFGKSAEDLASDTALRGRLKEMASDEYYEKQRKADMWQTLAEIGFNMASSKSPYLLQAIGEAAAAAMPGARADKKERKALKDRALEGLVEMGARDRKEALQKFDIVKDIYKQGVSQEQFEKRMGLEERQLDQQAQQIAQEGTYKAGMLGLQQQIAAEGKSDLQRIFNTVYDQYKARNEQGIHPDGRRINYKLSDAEIRARAMEEAAKRFKTGQMGGAIPGLTDVPAPAGGASAPADFSGMSIVGSRPAQ